MVLPQFIRFLAEGRSLRIGIVVFMRYEAHQCENQESPHFTFRLPLLFFTVGLA